MNANVATWSRPALDWRWLAALAVAVGVLWLLEDRGDGLGDMFEDAGPGEEVTGYFVDPDGGSDSNGGQSYDDAWASVTKVNSSVSATGSDVWFIRGGEWQNQQLNVDWPGTVNNKVIIGCYYVDGGTPVSCETGSNPITARNDPGKPNLIGGLNDTCLAAQNCTGYNTLRYSYLITADEDYLTIQDLELSYFAGGGLGQRGDRGGQDDNAYELLVQRMNINNMGEISVVAEYDAQNFIIRDNLIFNINWCENNQRSDLVADCAYGGPWPGVASFVRLANAQGLIENNTIYNSIGEGILIGSADHVVVRGNKVGNQHSAGIYMQHADWVLVEDNIIWGNPDIGNGDGPSTPGNWRRGNNFDRISIYHEDFNRNSAYSHKISENIVVRNNMVSSWAGPFTGATTLAWGTEPLGSAEGSTKAGGFFYGNSIVTSGLPVDGDTESVNDLLPIDLKYNIFIRTTGSPVCDFTGTTAPVTSERNVFSETPAADCDGTGNVVGPVTFPNAYSFYTDLSFIPPQLPTITNADWLPTSGGNADDMGASIADDPDAVLNDASWQWVKDVLGPIDDSNQTPVFKTQKILTDQNGVTRSTTNDDAGALVH